MAQVGLLWQLRPVETFDAALTYHSPRLAQMRALGKWRKLFKGNYLRFAAVLDPLGDFCFPADGWSAASSKPGRMNGKKGLTAVI